MCHNLPTAPCSLTVSPTFSLIMLGLKTGNHQIKGSGPVIITGIGYAAINILLLLKRSRKQHHGSEKSQTNEPGFLQNTEIYLCMYLIILICLCVKTKTCGHSSEVTTDGPACRPSWRFISAPTLGL